MTSSIELIVQFISKQQQAQPLILKSIARVAYYDKIPAPVASIQLRINT